MDSLLNDKEPVHLKALGGHRFENYRVRAVKTGTLIRGRVELVTGKGNEMRQLPMFGVASGEQWDQLAEKYELLRRLWREENVTWEGTFRGPLDSVTSLPRPFAGAPRPHGPRRGRGHR